MKCTLVKPNPCPFCGEQLQLVTELSPIETTSGKVISEFRMNYYKHTETDKCPLGYGFVLGRRGQEVEHQKGAAA